MSHSFLYLIPSSLPLSTFNNLFLSYLFPCVFLYFVPIPFLSFPICLNFQFPPVLILFIFTTFPSLVFFFFLLFPSFLFSPSIFLYFFLLSSLPDFLLRLPLSLKYNCSYMYVRVFIHFLPNYFPFVFLSFLCHHLLFIPSSYSHSTDVKTCRTVKLTTHFHPVLRLRMCGALPPFCLNETSPS